MGEYGGIGSDIFEIYKSLPKETLIFLWLIVFLLVLFHLKFTKKVVTFGPTILTTLGIFATFLGIALGLSKFDAGNVQASVPALLGGLKTAFWASVMGVFGALTIKFRDYFVGSGATLDGVPESGDEVTASDLIRALNGIHRGLVGSEEGSLISQMKLSRQDSNDRLDQLKAAQLDALAKLSEMGSRTLIEALKEVVETFNQKLNAQFGENFKQLNSAVGLMVDWQKEFRQTVETVVAKFEETWRLTDLATKNYATVVENSNAFVDSAGAMGLLLEEANRQQDDLSSVMDGLVNLLKEAAGSVPQIESRLGQLTLQMTTAVSENQKILSEALTDHASSIRSTIKSVSDGLQNSNADANRQFGEIAARTKDQVGILDKALSDELEKSLTSLGRQLTALSERFVSDYTPLTDKLRRLIEIAERA